MKKTEQSIDYKNKVFLGVAIVIIIALVLIVGSYSLGYVAADGTPDIIDLTSQQEANIVKAQERECNIRIINETKTLKATITEKDEFIEKLMVKQDYFLGRLTALNDRYLEVKNTIIDLNTSINDLNC